VNTFGQGTVHMPRLLLAAGASGSGKTLITCGILQALLNRGLKSASFKCGPDYIDPMFHRTVLGTASGNLDTFFTDEQTTRYLFARRSTGADLALIEGVMGYYDGLGGVSVQGSAWHVASVTDTPVVLIVNCKGMSLSVLAFIKGFLEYRKDSRIRAVILNRISPMIYPKLAQKIREELGITVLGYVPEMKDLTLQSRHLGLVMPDEVDGIREKLNALAQVLAKSLDLDELIRIAGEAQDFEAPEPQKRKSAVRKARKLPETVAGKKERDKSIVIAVAKDEAFCFLYEDNLELLEDMGAKIRFFSPVHDSQLPPCDGLILCGGYPELYLQQLSENVTMLASIREAVAGRALPCLAECGGFMYLQSEMEDMDKKSWPVAGVLRGRAFRTEKLSRFGYIELTPSDMPKNGLFDNIGPIRGHEFHYFDTTDNGEACIASKPLGKRQWTCMHMTQTMAVGFPHLCYHSNPETARRFFEACVRHSRA